MAVARATAAPARRESVATAVGPTPGGPGGGCASGGGPRRSKSARMGASTPTGSATKRSYRSRRYAAFGPENAAQAVAPFSSILPTAAATLARVYLIGL